MTVRPSRSRERHLICITPYGGVNLTFWNISHASLPKISDQDTTESASVDETFGAKVAIVPNQTVESPLRVVVDFTPHLNPSATITYHAFIPNDSEIFEIVKYGQVKDLIKFLDNRSASLTNRDEEGRSLLHVSCQEAFFEQMLIS